MSIDDPRSHGRDISSRRAFLGLGIALTLPLGACAAPVRNLRDVNLGALRPSQVLMLGRFRIEELGVDVTGASWLSCNATDEGYLLPSNGEVSWLVKRPRVDVRLSGLATSNNLFRAGSSGAVLAPAAATAPIVYFGTISLTFSSGFANRSSGRAPRLETSIADDQVSAMATFVAENPSLAGRPYYHVLQGALREAPHFVPVTRGQVDPSIDPTE